MLSKKILNFLDKAKVKYEVVEHKTVYTAFDKSATLRVPKKIIGKTLVIKIDGKYAFVLIPANKNLDKNKFKNAVNKWRKKLGQKAIKKMDFAKEAWMKKNLKGIKIGATPPFGNLWKMPVFADRGLLQNPKIILNGGNYIESIKITPAGFKKLIPDLVVDSFSKAKK